MPIQYIITRDNIEKYRYENLDNTYYYKDGSILFASGGGMDIDFVKMPYRHQTIIHNQVDEEEKYKFLPSNIILFIGEQQVLIEKEGINTCHQIAPGRESELEDLKHFLSKLVIKQRGRNLAAVAELGVNRSLPPTVEGIIGKYISGKNSSFPSQVNQLKQKLGISLAPRANGRTRTKRKNKSD